MADAASLKRFLFELDAMLAPLGTREPRETVSACAAGLPANARAGFLISLANALL